MDTPLLYGQFIPVVGFVIMTFTLIEAAGAADYKPLKGTCVGLLALEALTKRLKGLWTLFLSYLCRRNGTIMNEENLCGWSDINDGDF